MKKFLSDVFFNHTKCNVLSCGCEVYLEIGAFDGIESTNTLLFEYCFGWSGILIEPGLSTYQRLVENRPQNYLFNNAIGCEGEISFIDHGWTAMKMDGKQLK